MGKLADLAKTKSLKGKVQVTFKDGTSKTYMNEADAEKACAALNLEHKRGAFFEADGPAPAVVTAEAKPAKSKK